MPLGTQPHPPILANTYTQIYIQVVFAVKGRQSLIRKEWKDGLHKYMTGIIQNYGHKVLQINGVADHVHILMSMKPSQSISDLMKQVKQDSSKWINQSGYVRGRFSWQAGYGAFSYSPDAVPKVIQYIQNQEEHHSTKPFYEEYLKFLDEYEVDYNEQYLFKKVGSEE